MIIWQLLYLSYIPNISPMPSSFFSFFFYNNNLNSKLAGYAWWFPLGAAYAELSTSEINMLIVRLRRVNFFI